MNKKIVVRIFGGLGNQLFCYAAARRLSIVNNAELVIDHISGFKYDYKYTRNYQLHHFNIPCRLAKPNERFEPFSRMRRAFKKRMALAWPFHKRTYVTQEGMDFDERLLDLKTNRDLYIEGYWQSEKYFKDVEKVIRKDLLFKDTKDKKNLSVLENIEEQNSIAIHVRFFEETDTENSLITTEDYYKRAIQRMIRLVPGGHFFLFSDKPEKAKYMLNKIGISYTLVSHNNSDETAYLDLWLMSKCNHFIIANSTFSWWGAWLSSFPDKIVIAPGFVKIIGAMKWGYDGLLPKKWIKI